MQIGDTQEAATRDVAARREAMVGQLRQLVDRLNVAPAGAIPPAAIQADTVRISPEARQAMNSLAGAGQASGGASPNQVIAAIRNVLLAATPQASAAATTRLAELVRNIVSTFPVRGAASLRGYPIDDRAADLVRALLPPAPGGAAPEPPAIASLVRSLFAGHGGAEAPPEAALQRAALAIFLAATRTAAEPVATPLSQPAAEQQAAPREFPAALLGHLAPPGEPRRTRPAFRRRGDDDRPEDDGEDRDDRRDEADSEDAQTPDRESA